MSLKSIQTKQQQQTTNDMKYTSNGFKSVQAESMREAAEIFATRAARRKYGRLAYCRTCTQQAHAQDGSLAEYSAFIGYKTGQSETTGSDIKFTVRGLTA